MNDGSAWAIPGYLTTEPLTNVARDKIRETS